eukprot:45890-Amphidinium_carterae.1
MGVKAIDLKKASLETDQVAIVHINAEEHRMADTRNGQSTGNIKKQGFLLTTTFARQEALFTSEC